MKKLLLTTKLNVEITCVVILVMVIVTTYTHWLSLNEENEKNSQWLVAITEFLARKELVDIYAESIGSPDIAHLSTQEQIAALNKKLQPLLNEIVVPSSIIKFGLYSRQHENIIAIGPIADTSLLFSIKPERFNYIYSSNTDQFRETDNSLIWHGAKGFSHIRPIQRGGITLGHAFASVNQDVVFKTIWNRTLNTLLGAFIMLLICVAIFREIFIRLKKDLELFAEAIVEDRADSFHSEIDELTPILNHIHEQTKKMTQLDRLNIIGEMAASIAHEVRNPMTTVRGLLQFIGFKPEFSKQKANFDLMIEEIDRANCIITEFLGLAKNNVMEFHEYNLNTIIHEISPLLQADALRHNSELIMKLDDVPAISADQHSIRQLILNLVRNGLDAMPNGGTITITTRTAGDKVFLSIEDTGIGIPPEIRDKLGTPFFTTKECGTGLGLAICYRIIQRHGATLTLESEPNKGTIFTVGFMLIDTAFQHPEDTITTTAKVASNG